MHVGDARLLFKFSISCIFPFGVDFHFEIFFSVTTWSISTRFTPDLREEPSWACLMSECFGFAARNCMFSQAVNVLSRRKKEWGKEEEKKEENKKKKRGYYGAGGTCRCVKRAMSMLSGAERWLGGCVWPQAMQECASKFSTCEPADTRRVLHVLFNNAVLSGFWCPAHTR